MKTHHWAGATLSMKNFFGVVPGSVYGWPKNKLHYLGIAESIVALNRQFGEQGVRDCGRRDRDGRQWAHPGHAQTRRSAGDGARPGGGGRHLRRIMGIDPEKLDYLRQAADLGHVHPARIEQRGETIASVQTNFALIDQYKGLRLA